MACVRVHVLVRVLVHVQAYLPFSTTPTKWFHTGKESQKLYKHACMHTHFLENIFNKLGAHLGRL